MKTGSHVCNDDPFDTLTTIVDLNCGFNRSRPYFTTVVLSSLVGKSFLIYLNPLSKGFSRGNKRNVRPSIYNPWSYWAKYLPGPSLHDKWWNFNVTGTDIVGKDFQTDVSSGGRTENLERLTVSFYGNKLRRADTFGNQHEDNRRVCSDHVNVVWSTVRRPILLIKSYKAQHQETSRMVIRKYGSFEN